MGSEPSGKRSGTPRTNFFHSKKSHYTRRMFRDLPIRARELKASPEVLERIYDGARLGLKGDSLALAAGLLPEEAEAEAQAAAPPEAPKLPIAQPKAKTP